MQVKLEIGRGVHYITANNILTPDELQMLWATTEYIIPHMRGPEHTGASSAKRGTGIFTNLMQPVPTIHHIINDRFKQMLSYIEKNIPLSSPLQYGKHIRRCDTLVQNYKNNDGYNFHVDLSALTCCYTYFKQPKDFSGGNFCIPSIDVDIEATNNSAIIFPSFLEHAVSDVSTTSHDKLAGRFSICTLAYTND